MTAGTSQSRHTRRTSRITRGVATFVGLTLMLGTVPTSGVADAASAQTDERSRREEVRRQRSVAAAELDVLRASDAQLEAAVAELTQNVQAQEARVADARRASDEARELADRLSAEIATTEGEVATLESLVQERAVQAYIASGDSSAPDQAILNADDPTDLERRRALLSAVHGSDRDAIDQLGGARERLERQRADAAEAIEAANAHQAETEARLGELAGARSEQQRMQQNLETRITGFRAEVDALSAEEAQLTALITQYEQQAQARATAAREQQRQADAAAAAAANSQRTAPSNSGSSSSSSSSSTEPTSSEPSTQVASGGGLVWPAAGAVTSGFGQRWGRLHAGIDIGAPTGTPIYAAASGTVITASYQAGNGKLVLVDHGNGMVTAYAHMSRFGTSGGASVSQGQVIGYVGNTGNSTGPHLHFETRVNGTPRNPMNYL